MAYIRSRKFCCCLPVRFGVFVMGLIGMLGGGFVAVVGWLQIKDSSSLSQLDPRDKAALITSTVMYTVLAIVSLFGFIGTFNKSHALISWYSQVLFYHLGFSIATGAFFLYTLFHQTGDTNVQKCIAGSTDQVIIEACQKTAEILRGITVGLFVFMWLVELYGCVIVANYKGQLEEEQALDGSNTVGPSAPVLGSYNPPTGPNYAFANPDNSYGAQGRGNGNRV